MRRRTTGPEIERLIQALAKLPGLGPRSARRAALFLIKNREKLLVPLSTALSEARDKVQVCSQCGNVDTIDPCTLCGDPNRDRSMICVVEEVGDLWALERASAWSGLYHVLGGALSAVEGVRPEDLSITRLIELFSINPQKIIKVVPWGIFEGSAADLTILDLNRNWTFDVNRSHSRLT